VKVRKWFSQRTDIRRVTKMTKATRTKTKTSINEPREIESEAQQPANEIPEPASSKSNEIAYIERTKQPGKGEISRKDADALIKTLDLVTTALTDSIDRGKVALEAIKQNTKPGGKDTKALIAATQSHIDSDEKTQKAIEDVKKSVTAQVGKSTGEGVLQSIANAKPKDITTPEHRAQAILAHAAELQIEKSQHPRAVIIERSLKLGQLVPMEKGKERLDIRGRIALPERILPGVAYSDKKGQRLSRARHRNWKRIKLA
jgi:hypothetical protein